MAAKVVENPPNWLRAAAAKTVYAPWLVANIHINSPLQDRPGAPPSWDSVIYSDTPLAPGLGYVDASHQGLHPVPAATVLTHYRALGDVVVSPDNPQLPAGAAGRHLLLQQPWHHWRDTLLAELSAPHPDLAAKVTRIDVTRYGHAMAVPVPSADGRIGLQPRYHERRMLQNAEHFQIRHERLNFAHSDWAGYSVFEEAFTLGHWAASLT